MKKKALEDIKSDLFNSLSPEEERCVIGGITDTISMTQTHTPTGWDSDWVNEIDWSELEGAQGAS